MLFSPPQYWSFSYWDILTKFEDETNNKLFHIEEWAYLFSYDLYTRTISDYASIKILSKYDYQILVYLHGLTFQCDSTDPSVSSVEVYFSKLEWLKYNTNYGSLQQLHSVWVTPSTNLSLKTTTLWITVIIRFFSHSTFSVNEWGT